MDKGDLKQAETVYREALELRRRAYGTDSLEVAQSLNNLSSVVDTQGRCDESEDRSWSRSRSSASGWAPTIRASPRRS